MNYGIEQDDYEIERKMVLEKIGKFFSSTEKQKCVVNIFGESGIGKSIICRRIYKMYSSYLRTHTVLIDFNQVINKSVPGIIGGIIENIGPSFFPKTQRKMEKYYTSIDASKAEFLRQCTDTFISELNIFASIQTKPILLVFDTYEALPIEIQHNEFRQIIEKSRDNILFLIAGIYKMNAGDYNYIAVDGFFEDEIQDFFIKQNPKMKTIFKNHGKILASKIRDFTNRGNPILCGLLSDCIERCADIDEQIDYLLGEKKDASYQHLVNWMGDLDINLQTALRLTAYFNDRMTPDLLSEVSMMPITICRKMLKDMLDFSFVKNYSISDELNQQVVLHDVVAKLIRKYYPYSNEELSQFANRAVVAYDKMIERDKNNIDAFKEGTALRIERVLSLVRNGDFNKAIVLFDSEIINSLDEFDYSFTKQLINEVDVLNKTVCDSRWIFIVQVAKANFFLRQYNVMPTVDIFNSLMACELYKDRFFKAMADSVHGLLLVNPCTIDTTETLSDAINILKASLPTLAEYHLVERVVKINYWLGIAYVRTGQNDLAFRAFENAKEINTTSIQKVDILLEMSKMIRLQQDVLGSFKPLEECDVIMAQGRLKNKNKGKYYYYKGNAYRDLGNNDLAISFYDQAFLELDGGDDDFTLCELNLDYAWLEYLRRDDVSLKQLHQYLDRGWTLAQKYHFGTEYSEYHHILYEIEYYLGDDVNAYVDLHKAIDYAYKYSNIYMILDCLNHQAQMYFREGEYGKIQGVLNEMKLVEDTGCKIRVFRGRARLVLADVFFKDGLYDKAINEYFEGFLIIALYGNSYTNVELFEDLYNGNNDDNIPRKEKINICLSQLPNARIFKRRFKMKWQKDKVSHDYDYFIENMKWRTK